jgi:hypothetical protein
LESHETSSESEPLTSSCWRDEGLDVTFCHILDISKLGDLEEVLELSRCTTDDRIQKTGVGRLIAEVRNVINNGFLIS